MLVNKAKDAAENAYAPYSNFQVGTAIVGAEGTVYLGNNQENAAYPSGMCAERVALFAAHASNPKLQIRAVGVIALVNGHIVPAPPCGSCRQVMLEYATQQERTFEVLFGWEKGTFIVANGIEDLLPLNFSIKNLKPNLDPHSS